MKFKNFLFLLLVISIILSTVSFIAAGEYNNESSAISLTDDNELKLLDENNYIDSDKNGNDLKQVVDVLSKDEVLSTEDDVYVAYVGQNITENGDGSPENPFATLKLACDDANTKHRVNVTINIKEGIYYLGSQLDFDTDNLLIQGEGDVVIKNMYNYKVSTSGMPSAADYAEAFGLTSSSSKFTASNIIFDASTHTENFLHWDLSSMMPGLIIKSYFLPFFGQTSLAVFDNCSFIGFKNANYLMGNEIQIGMNNRYYYGYNSTFNNCFFNVDHIIGGYAEDIELIFEYCEFHYINTPDYFGMDMKVPSSVSILMNNVWFGQMGLPKYISSSYRVAPGDYIIPVSKYAIFNVTQNYLGNDEYEIIGKLTWNGTEEQDGMENFQPMTVTLLSENGGEIASSVPLVNGAFNTTYKNSVSTHHITATLHNQDIDLVFTTVNISANEASIKYGEDQNITVNLSQAIDNNVTITVSNATYNKTYVVKVNGTDSFTFTIPDRLKAGTYNVNITLNNGTLFGFNTTTLTVSKVSDYKFEVIPSSNVKVGDTATITITLPDDVNGTVTVKFGNEAPKSLPAEGLMTFNFTNLKAITYSVNVTYSGNDKYTSKSIPDSVTVDKADSSLEINDAVFTYGDVITIPFSVTNANGVTVSVLNKDGDEVANTSSNSNIITLDALPAGEYTLYVRTVVDKDNYNWVDKSPKLTINKANSSLIVSDKEFTYATEAIINAITVNSTGNVIATLYDENNKEITVTVSGDNITLPLLNAGKYTLSVTTNVDENHTNVTKTATVTIVKATPSISVDVFPENETFEGNELTLDVKLSGDATGLVLVDITDNNKLFGELNNSAVKFTLNNLVVGDYNIKVTYVGDNNYNSANKTVNIKVNAKEESNANITIPADIKIGGDNNVKIDLPQNANGTVTLKIDGKVVSTVPVVNGSANISLDNLTSGNHIVEIAYSGDDKYAPVSSTKVVKIEKQNVVIVVDKTFTRVAVDYNAGERGAMFYAILKDANGNLLVNKTVQVAYNGEIYNKITDNQGRVGLQVNLAKAGTYPITISFAGDDTYNASPLTLAKLTVTKKKTTIKASNKVFKAKKKSKKISVTLKTVKNPYDKKTYLKSGKKVTLKVKGKTYTAKINKKGVAKFTIKLTKKGKYTAKIKFAGDDTYKASSKTIKIRIK